VVLTGEYGGLGGFPAPARRARPRGFADGEENLAFSWSSCGVATGKPLTDRRLRLIARYPRQLALLFPGQLTQAS